MVEATNYVYLAILICLQYLGLQHESYQITVDFSKIEELEQRASVLVNLEKVKDKENEWVLIAPDKNQTISLRVLKDSITLFDKGRTNSTTFKEIDFERLTKQKDTIFNKKQKPVVTISKDDNSIVFKMIDNIFYEKVTMKINK